MCGLAGFKGPANCGLEELHASAARMADSLAHRGPDSSGVWADPNTGIGLGHRRLSILDLSKAGHQPMHSACDRFVIVYNGEVYNAPGLRTELEAHGHTFRGHSDTEVILAAIVQFGLATAVTRFIGMFALALWDKRERTLHLVRDRMGIKPLYWGWSSNTFLFGSELKAITAHATFERRIDPNVLAAYFRFNYVPTPHCIFKGIQKLEPGTILTLSDGGSTTISRYWSLREIAANSCGNRITLSDEAAIEQGETLLKDAVKKRMIADVPLGAFLSGGIDSSLVVALMQAQSDTTVRTYTIGFDVDGYDESAHAQAVADHLGTNHTELRVTPEDAQAVIPRLAEWYDEPFADSSQIPTYLVSKLTRNHVTVALSGDGGDELFGGYERYRWGERLRRSLRPIPPIFRKPLAGMLQAIPPTTWDRLLKQLPIAGMPAHPGDKIRKIAEILALQDTESLFRRLITCWEHPEQLVRNAVEPKDNPIWDENLQAEIPNFVDRMQYLDSVTYLPDDILTKVDRASMAVSLEARVPLIDHRVTEFSWTLPSHQKIRSGESKWLLRRILERYVPSDVINRPKMGFGIPVGQWIRGPLREWSESLIMDEGLEHDGLLDSAVIREIWKEHQTGRRDWTVKIWTVLMFQAWKARWS